MTPTTDIYDAPDQLEDSAAAVLSEGDDPVLAALGRFEGEYRSTRDQWAREVSSAERARDQAAADARDAQAENDHLRGQLEHARRQAARHKEQAERLQAALQDIHRALFQGNVFDLILRACLSLTGATRGVYLTVDGGPPKARAAVGVDGYPKKEPSPFLRQVCEKVLAEDGQEYISNHPGGDGLPAPADPAERFENVLAAPAVLLKSLHGVVFLADKPNGGFDKDDVELVMSVGEHAGVALENRKLQEELLKAYFSVVAVLADAVEAKDPYTHGHSGQVAKLARLTAARLAADDHALRSLCCYGGLLHDVGKIGISDGVLNKPGRLTPEEWGLMQSHTRIGKELLARVPALDGVAGVVMHHHEKYDGTGYPDGLAADQIPLAARIVGVVDAYCAITSKRSYKESAPPEAARAELVRCRGSHFDPRVVDAFLAVLDDPDAADGCADDGCGLTPELAGADDLRHVLAGAAARRG